MTPQNGKMKHMAESTKVTFWQKKPTRLFEASIVALFLALPPIGLFAFLYLAWQNDPGRFWGTVQVLAGLALAIGLHIRFVRPKLTKIPFVDTYADLGKRVSAIRARFGARKKSLISAIYARRISRTAYRVFFTVIVGLVVYRLYDLHGSQFLWQVAKYAMAGFGITFGYHRLSHKAFQAPKWVQVLAYAGGSTANQGPIGEWYRKHLKHHSFSETSVDVHSPIVLEESRRGVAMAWFTTFLHSFCFWALKEPSLRRRAGQSVEQWQQELWEGRPKVSDFLYRPEDENKWGTTIIEVNGRTIEVTTQEKLDKEWKRYIEKLKEVDSDKIMTVMSNPLVYFLILAFGAFLIPYWVGGVNPLASLASLCVLSWATFSVNSVSHLWGERPFNTQDSACNNAVVEVLALGEGGHNTHHHKAGYAIHGAFAWMFDPTGWLVRILHKLGILKGVIYPTRDELREAWREWQGRQREAMKARMRRPEVSLR